MYGVFIVASVVVDLSSVPEKEFKTRKNPSGKRYLELRYEIELAIQATMELSLVVNGKKYGSLKAAFE
ncbi:hypothetical protein G6514_002308 [Epicoccum nigrum]|nr:hypothetical protein G6514_002308 [Epicoccum nigrum]